MREKKLIYILIGTIICIFTFSILVSNNNEKAVFTSSTVVSNKKIGWGIKRAENHEQPDLGSSNLKLLQEYDEIAMGNEEDKYVYLTFDNGYEAGYTASILDTLKANDVKAAFFITGHYLNSQEELVKRMIDEGHIVGNHTVNHYSMPDIDDEKIKNEIMNLHTSLYEKFGYEMKYIRPPMGEFSERTLNIINSLRI